MNNNKPNTDNSTDGLDLQLGDEGIVIKDDTGKPVIPNLEDDEIPSLTPTENDEFIIPDDVNEDEVQQIEIEGETYDLDEEGNAVDAEGNVVLSKDEFELEDAEEDEDTSEDIITTGDTINIDGVDLTIDEEGNAIDENNEIVYTLEELEEQLNEANETTSETSVETLAELSQIQPVDTEGNPIVYTDDNEGRRKYIEDVYEAGALGKANEVLQEYYDMNPMIKIATDYILTNGSLEGFNDSEMITVPEVNAKTTESVLVNIIRQARLAKGDSETEIAQAVNWAKSDGKLLDLGKQSEEYLNKTLEDKRNESNIAAQERVKAIRESNKVYYNTLDKAINTDGKIKVGNKTLTIPKLLEINNNGTLKTVDRSKLLEYATRIEEWDVNGKTIRGTKYQMDKDRASQVNNIDEDIFNMIKLFTGTNGESLINSAINKDKSQRIVRKFKSKESNAQRPAPRQRQTGKGIDSLGLKY